MERDRAVVSEVPAVARRRSPTQECPRGAEVILFVLKTGIGWKDLPTEAFDCSYKACLRRIREWSELGLWQRMHELLLAKLRGADQLDWPRILVDCSLVKAPLGGPKRGRIQQTEAAQTVSIAC